MKLSKILLLDQIVKFFSDIVAVLVVINSLFTVAFDYVFPQQSDSFVRHLTFTCSLFRSQQILYGVLGPTNLSRKKEMNQKRWHTSGTLFTHNLQASRYVHPKPGLVLHGRTVLVFLHETLAVRLHLMKPFSFSTACKVEKLTNAWTFLPSNETCIRPRTNADNDRRHHRRRWSR